MLGSGWQSGILPAVTWRRVGVSIHWPFGWKMLSPLRTHFWRERFILIRTAGFWHVTPCSQEGLPIVQLHIAVDRRLTFHCDAKFKLHINFYSFKFTDDLTLDWWQGKGGVHSPDRTPLAFTVHCIVIGSEVLVWPVGFSVERNGTSKRRRSDNQMGGELHRSLADKTGPCVKIQDVWDETLYRLIDISTYRFRGARRLHL
jgi:hypothetical protein